MTAQVEWRPAARHDEKEKDIQEELIDFLHKFPLYKEFLEEFEKNADSQKLCDRSIPYNEQRLKEDGHFYLDMSKTNYLTILYRKAKNRPKTEEQNRATLDKDPKNIRALYLRVELFKQEKKYRDAEDTLNQLKEAAADRFYLLTAKAEIAMNYPDLGPAYYQRSVTVLEDVLQELNSSSEMMDKMPEGRLIKWKYDLAHTYDKVMNKGNVQTYWIGKHPTTSFLFKRIKGLLLEVIDSSDAFYSPKSWIDLADAFKKYEERLPGRGEEIHSLPEGMTVDDCFERALKLGQNDPFVLERCGRHWRHRATDRNGLNKAIELLKRCTHINPLSDVAYHHMGLAYKALWLIDENHEERWLYINRTKKYGEKKSMWNHNQRNFSQQQNQTKYDHKKYNARGYGSKYAKHDHSGQETALCGSSFARGNSRGQTGVELSEKPGKDTSQCQGRNPSYNTHSKFSSVVHSLTNDQVFDSGFVEGQASSISSTANLESITESKADTDAGNLVNSENQSSMSDLQSSPINGANQREQHSASSNEQVHALKRSRVVSSGSESPEGGRNISLAENTQPTEVIYNRSGYRPVKGQFQTIPPKHPKKENEVPQHYRRGDYHDRLRTGDPVARDPRHPDLIRSRDCFKKASDIRHGSCGKYLIDLARTYMSTRDFKRAKQIFMDSDSTQMNDSDGSYLFEQWGLLLEKSEDTDLEEVKNMYRTSVKCSASARQRSKVAFNRLKRIIEEQMEKNPDDILQKEQLILSTTIQDTETAEKMWQNMTSDECLPLIWELVGMYHRRARPTDATAAFDYLAILANANKLREVDGKKSEGRIEKICKERAKQVIEIAENRLENGGNAKSTLSSVYKWLLALTSSKDVNLREAPPEATKIRIVAPSCESPEVGMVEEILREVMGIEYRELYRSGSSDILAGSSVPDVILSDLKAAHCVIAVLQSAGKTSDEQAILYLLKDVLNDKDHVPRRICRAVSKRSPIIQDDRLSTLRQWNLDAAGEVSNINSKTALAVNLLKVLFLQ